MDRVYTSKELLAVEFHTNTFYIGKHFYQKSKITHFKFQFLILDHGGAHKLCVMEVVKGADERLLTDQR